MPAQALAEIPLLLRMAGVRQVIRQEEASAEQREELFLLGLYPPSDVVGQVEKGASIPTQVGLHTALSSEERLERKRARNRAYYARRFGKSYSADRRSYPSPGSGDPRPLAAAP